MAPISVVMATYNGKRFIHEQLESILAQTMLPAEIVVTDDGSTDGTPEIIEAYAARCPLPIAVHRNAARLGFADNFLKAARLSASPFIAFADQDDVWLPQKLKSCHDMMEQTGAVLCSPTMMLVDEKRTPIALSHQEIKKTGTHPPLTLEPWGIFSGLSEMFDRRLLDLIPAAARGVDNVTYDKPLAHDRWVFFLASHFGTIAVINEPMVEYRQHGSNTVGSTHKSLIRRFNDKVAEGPPRLARYAELAEFRVAMLREARTDAAGRQFDAAIRRWETIAAHCRRRHDLYVAAGLARRAAVLVRSLAEGAYRSSARAGLGPKRLLEDVSLGLFGKILVGWDSQ
jgi:glycosyltransferase involved in cell wall biosynthesis